MKYLAVVLLTAFSCSVSMAQQAGAKGKLYIEDSIAGGLRLYWLYLGDDGTFVQDPKNGVNPINYALERQNNAANVGTYVQAGNKITVHYDKGRTEVWNLDYQNGVLNTINGLYVSLAKPMPAGYKLKGDFSSGIFLSNVASIQTFTFNNNGTFNLKGMGAVNTPQTTATATANSGGNYNITGNTLRLNFTNGQKSVSVIGINGTGTSAYMVINNSYFGQK